MLKLLLLLLLLEAPQDSRGSDINPPPLPPPSCIRMSPRLWSSVSPTSAIRSAEKTVEAPRGSSSSTKLRASRSREGVAREEKGWGRVGERRVEEEEAEGGEEEEEEARPWRRAWSSSSYKKKIIHVRVQRLETPFTSAPVKHICIQVGSVHTCTTIMHFYPDVIYPDLIHTWH